MFRCTAIRKSEASPGHTCNDVPCVQVDEYTLSRIELLRNPDRAVAKRRAQYLALFAALAALYKRRSLTVKRNDGGIDALARQTRTRAELLQELLDKFYDHR